MPDKENRTIVPSSGGVFQDLVLRLKLIMRLIADPRVSALLKIIPIGALVYLIFPDLGPGPIDDAAILWVGFYMFVELCPPNVVEEHMAALTHSVASHSQNPRQSAEENEIIDAEYREDV